MDLQLAEREVARLEAVVRAPGGTTAFASLSEAHRLSGRPEEAERVARDGLRRHPDHTSGRVALGLALLDLGRLDEARGELVRALDAVPDHPLAAATLPGAASAAAAEPVMDAELMDDLGEGELEQAFASAEADPESMLDANGVAEAVVRAVESEPDDDIDADAPEPSEESPFATRSMAEILERQGHGAEADRVRGEVEAREVPLAAPANAEEPERERAVRRLEGWLDQLRKGRR